MKSISVSDGTNADQVIQGQGLTIGLDSGSPAVALKKALYDQVVAALGATVPQGSSVPVVNCTLMRDARLTLAMSDTLSITIPVEDFEMNIPQLKTGGNCPVAIISGNYPAGKESRWRTPPPPPPVEPCTWTNLGDLGKMFGSAVIFCAGPMSCTTRHAGTSTWRGLATAAPTWWLSAAAFRPGLLASAPNSRSARSPPRMRPATIKSPPYGVLHTWSTGVR